MDSIEAIRILSQVKSLNINAIDKKRGVNAFWIAAFFGQNEVKVFSEDDINCRLYNSLGI